MTVRHYSSAAGKMILQIGVNSIATALQVDTTAGLPGAIPFTLLIDVGLPTEEIVTVSQVSGNTLVVIRGEDGTSAQPHASGAVIRHAVTARDFRDSRDHENSTSGVHGANGTVVGTTDNQTLTNKNLSSPTNTFPASLATDAELATETAARVAHAASTTTHGVTGSIVGTTDTQTLTNKTLSGQTFAGDVKIGDLASNTTRQFGVRRKAFTGTNAYEGIAYIQSGDANGNLSLILQENAVEVARLNLKYNGDLLVSSGNILADNIPAGGVAGTSTAKAGKRLHWGSATVNQSGGFATITHGAGFTPTVITITPSIAWQAAVTAITSTQFTVALRDDAGTAPTSSVTVYYICGE